MSTNSLTDVLLMKSITSVFMENQEQHLSGYPKRPFLRLISACTICSIMSIQLTLSTIVAISADDKLVIFCLFYPDSRMRHHANCLLGKKKNLFKMLSAEIITQYTKH